MAPTTEIEELRLLVHAKKETTGKLLDHAQAVTLP